MADTNISPQQRPAAAPGVVSPGSYVEWGAVIAGTISALAVSFVLLSFGAALGFSAVSPWTATAGTVTAVSLGAALWMLMVNVWAFALGGYLSGRMRHRWNDARQSEVDFRDAAHGLLAWAGAVTVAAVLGALISSSSPGKREDRSMGNAVVALAVDKVLRTTAPVAASPAAAQREALRGDREALRDEVSRLIVASSAAPKTVSEDRAYLSDLIASRTGVTKQEAELRIDAATVDLKVAADRARKVAIVVGFLLSAVLLVGGAAAWWAAGVGGRHRDANTVWDVFTRLPRRI